MRLYYYMNKKNGLRALKDARLKVSRIHNLNDPFEFLAPSATDKERRRALRNLKSLLHKTTGILCFSANKKNPVMWAHYANRHRGLCLGFDVAVRDLTGDVMLRKVDYVDQRLEWPEQLDKDFGRRVMVTKFKHWNYEQEWRVFVDLHKCDKRRGEYFIPFGDDLVLREVYIGLASRASRNDVTAAIEDIGDIDVIKTRAAFQTFEVVENRAERPQDSS